MDTKLALVKKSLSFKKWFRTEKSKVCSSTSCENIAKTSWTASRRCFQKSEDIATLRRHLGAMYRLAGRTTMNFVHTPTNQVQADLQRLFVTASQAVNLLNKMEQGLKRKPKD